jgi:hypothetical protein
LHFIKKFTRQVPAVRQEGTQVKGLTKKVIDEITSGDDAILDETILEGH